MPLKITVTKPASITLLQQIAPNTAAASFDVLQVKKSMNRLGYYIPPADIGITDIPDSGLFTAIKAFQKLFGLPVTGIINPDDSTLVTLNAELQKPQNGHYVRRTVHDDHVRADHAAKDGMTRAWEDSPDPGDDFNCRCWAEAVPENINNKKWDNIDFINHFYNGNGKEIDLNKVGLLPDIIDRSNKIIAPKITSQISKIAEKIKGEKLEYKTENVYDFKPVLFSLRKSTITT